MAPRVSERPSYAPDVDDLGDAPHMNDIALYLTTLLALLHLRLAFITIAPSLSLL